MLIKKGRRWEKKQNYIENSSLVNIYNWWLEIFELDN